MTHERLSVHNVTFYGEPLAELAATLGGRSAYPG